VSHTPAVAPAASVPARADAAVAPSLPTDRWRPLEIAFWLVVVAAFFVFPQHRVLGSQILITGLFALSLDLILGYAGIVSLGHAAYFGIGAYTAGILAVHGWGEPISGLLAASVAGAVLGFATSFLVVRGSDLARLMVTLGIGLMLFCLRGLGNLEHWDERLLKGSFWALNIGLAAMALMSLLPYGLVQVHAAVSEGFWYARSAELLQQPLMQMLVWLRMPGDVVFSIGVLLLAVFVARLWLGGGRRQEVELPASARAVESSGR